MKKVVVIGGTGMLGRPVADLLARNGFHVVVLTRKEIPESENFNLEYVHGDLENAEVLNAILRDAYGIHVSLSGEAEVFVPRIVDCARQHQIKRITYLSGISVNSRNIGFINTRIKYDNEQAIIASGLSYAIFKPTWFMESLPLFINKGRASYFGKQKAPIPFVAAQDYATQVLSFYVNRLEGNRSYDMVGKSAFTFQEALTQLVKRHHPEIKSVSSLPYLVGKIIARVTGDIQLKGVVDFMQYFERAAPEIEVRVQIKGETSFDQWLTHDWKSK